MDGKIAHMPITRRGIFGHLSEIVKLDAPRIFSWPFKNPQQHPGLKKTKNLMQKYADLPMDFADATIVCLAADTGMQNIVTFDKKNFSIYKLSNKKSFTIMP